MRFLVVSDAPLLVKDGQYQAYAPYVKEMDLWMKHVTSTVFVCPTQYNRPLLLGVFKKQDLQTRELRRLEFHKLVSAVISLIVLPYQMVVLIKAMRRADHIHLRAPGNLCLLACFIQIFFPKKKKTAKYAGNWDPNANQPLSYKIQKKILSSTLLTKNMKVLVYGNWPDQSKNIKSFFTATYRDEELTSISKEFTPPFKALFVGTLGENKRPLETVQLIKSLRYQGVDIHLEMFGDGPVMEDIKWYRKENGILDQIILRGNQPSEVLLEAYKSAHFVFLLSKSEGWPKALAEAMFWGAIPIATPVSCVPWMLGEGSRGFLQEGWKEEDAITLSRKLIESKELKEMSVNAQKWSQRYTLDSFEQAISELL